MLGWLSVGSIGDSVMKFVLVCVVSSRLFCEWYVMDIYWLVGSGCCVMLCKVVLFRC